MAVRFGREVTFTVDGEPQKIWTTATTVDQAVGALGIDIGGAKLSTSRSSGIGRQGLTVDIATQKTITINDAGDRRQLKTTAQTVGQALAAAKITVDANDKLTPAKTAELKDGSKVSYTRVDVKAKTKKQEGRLHHGPQGDQEVDPRHDQGRHRGQHRRTQGQLPDRSAQRQDRQRQADRQQDQPPSRSTR